MNQKLISYSRTFQIWLYKVGHKQLLLRSAKDNIHSTRVDIFFKNVSAINLPTTLLEGFEMSEATDDDLRQFALRPDVVKSRKMYLITSPLSSGYVIAGLAEWHEDKLEYYDKSYFSDSLEPPGRPFHIRLYWLTKIKILMFIHRIKNTVWGS